MSICGKVSVPGNVVLPANPVLRPPHWPGCWKLRIPPERQSCHFYWWPLIRNPRSPEIKWGQSCLLNFNEQRCKRVSIFLEVTYNRVDKKTQLRIYYNGGEIFMLFSGRTTGSRTFNCWILMLANTGLVLYLSNFGMFYGPYCMIQIMVGSTLLIPISFLINILIPIYPIFISSLNCNVISIYFIFVSQR